MKTLNTLTLSLVCGLGLLLRATAQDAEPANTETPAAAQQPVEDQAAQQALEAAMQAAAAAAAAEQVMPDEQPVPGGVSQTGRQRGGRGVVVPGRNGTRRGGETSVANAVTVAANASGTSNVIMLNFKSAPLELMINYLSEAAGFVIVPEAPLSGTVDVYSAQPVSKESALAVLDIQLARNGFGFTRSGENGSVLRIFRQGSNNRNEIPVMVVQTTNDVQRSSQMVTAIIPVKFVTASQLTQDLYPLLPSTATMTANANANAIVLTDTQATVHRMVELIRAIDSPVSSVAKFRVIPIQNAEAKALAAVISSVYGSQGGIGGGGGGGGGANAIQQLLNLGGRGGGGGGGGRGGGGRN